MTKDVEDEAQDNIKKLTLVHTGRKSRESFVIEGGNSSTSGDLITILKIVLKGFDKENNGRVKKQTVLYLDFPLNTSVLNRK